jgi:hypothetical protein
VIAGTALAAAAVAAMTALAACASSGGPGSSGSSSTHRPTSTARPPEAAALGFNRALLHPNSGTPAPFACIGKFTYSTLAPEEDPGEPTAKAVRTGTTWTVTLTYPHRRGMPAEMFQQRVEVSRVGDGYCVSNLLSKK